jgi:hypothetical protein
VQLAILHEVSKTSVVACLEVWKLSQLHHGKEDLLLLLLLFGLWGYWHCGHSWPIVPASGDSEDDCGEADGM